jgi:hypothetical protein
MSDSDPTEVVLAGLPASGKTQYIAGLWLAVDGQSECRLHLANYKGDRRYLVEIGGRLAKCEDPPHTEVGESRTFDLPLQLDDDDKERRLRLIVPDLSGETWEHALEEAEWTVELDERISQASGLVVFVHSQASSGPTLGPLAASLPGDETSRDIHPFRVSGIAADSQLVQLIQLLRARRANPRIALVVSAWDLVEDDTLSPQAWLGENCKLLAQFVESRDDIHVNVWGISAQGGRFDDPEQAKRLLEADAVGRINVRDAENEIGAIEDPLLWATGWEIS